MERHVALLRGINVGGKNKLPMRDLARYFADEGCKEVRTYIQSGNVVFDAPKKVAGGIAKAIAARIEKELGLRVPVVMRTADELERISKNNPFLSRSPDAGELHVFFLADEPSAARIATLDPHRSPGDVFEISGRDIYLQLANGAGKTKLTNAYFDSKLATTSTLRNWRTVLALVELAAS